MLSDPELPRLPLPTGTAQCPPVPLHSMATIHPLIWRGNLHLWPSPDVTAFTGWARCGRFILWPSVLRHIGRRIEHEAFSQRAPSSTPGLGFLRVNPLIHEGQLGFVGLTEGRFVAENCI